MIRILAKQVPVFFAFKEQTTKSETDRCLRDLEFKYSGESCFVLNYADYLASCTCVDSYSKYTQKFPTKKFKSALNCLEYIVVNETYPQDLQAFAQTLALFQIECYMATIRLRSLWSEKYNPVILPTIPSRLKTIMQDNNCLFNPSESNLPKDNKLDLLGWLAWEFGDIFLQSCYKTMYDYISVENCKTDSYARYAFNMLQQLYYNAQDADSKRPFYIVPNLVGDSI